LRCIRAHGPKSMTRCHDRCHESPPRRLVPGAMATSAWRCPGATFRASASCSGPSPRPLTRGWVRGYRCYTRSNLNNRTTDPLARCVRTAHLHLVPRFTGVPWASFRACPCLRRVALLPLSPSSGRGWVRGYNSYPPSNLNNRTTDLLTRCLRTP
jgi:hypothetical protein